MADIVIWMNMSDSLEQLQLPLEQDERFNFSLESTYVGERVERGDRRARTSM